MDVILPLRGFVNTHQQSLWRGGRGRLRSSRGLLLCYSDHDANNMCAWKICRFTLRHFPQRINREACTIEQQSRAVVPVFHDSPCNLWDFLIHTVSSSFFGIMDDLPSPKSACNRTRTLQPD